MKENTDPNKTTIRLDEFVETLGKIVEARGMKCHTTECVFSIFPFCGIKEVHIHDGKCPHFNPALAPKDVSRDIMSAKVFRDNALFNISLTFDIASSDCAWNNFRFMM